MSDPKSRETWACGCVYEITVGTDGGSLVEPCVAHAPGSLVGKVGVCSRGRPGLITGRRDLPWGLSWIGIGLDDGTAWSSREPRILPAEEVAKLAEGKAVGARFDFEVQRPADGMAVTGGDED